MSKPFTRVGLVAGVLVVGAASAGWGEPDTCAPAKVLVAPVAGSNHRLYEGRTPTHRIEFVSERRGQLVDAFPEPPVRIIRRATGAACLIRSGGVWAGSGVYTGAGGRRFLLLEFSGSSATITIYDVDSCARQAEIDVSQALWHFVDGGVEVGRECKGTTIDECASRAVTLLRADCAPAKK